MGISDVDMLKLLRIPEQAYSGVFPSILNAESCGVQLGFGFGHTAPTPMQWLRLCS